MRDKLSDINYEKQRNDICKAELSEIIFIVKEIDTPIET